MNASTNQSINQSINNWPNIKKYRFDKHATKVKQYKDNSGWIFLRDLSINEPIKQWKINQSKNQSNNVLINQRMNQSINEQINQLMNKLINEQTSQSINSSVNQSMKKSANERVNQSMKQEGASVGP